MMFFTKLPLNKMFYHHNNWINQFHMYRRQRPLQRRQHHHHRRRQIILNQILHQLMMNYNSLQNMLQHYKTFYQNHQHHHHHLQHQNNHHRRRQRVQWKILINRSTIIMIHQLVPKTTNYHRLQSNHSYQTNFPNFFSNISQIMANPLCTLQEREPNYNTTPKKQNKTRPLI